MAEFLVFKEIALQYGHVSKIVSWKSPHGLSNNKHADMYFPSSFTQVQICELLVSDQV